MDKKFTLEELQAGIDIEATTGIEIPEELLDSVAGGAITLEEWNNLSQEEQRLLRLESSLLIKKGLPCPLVD